MLFRGTPTQQPEPGEKRLEIERHNKQPPIQKAENDVVQDGGMLKPAKGTDWTIRLENNYLGTSFKYTLYPQKFPCFFRCLQFFFDETNNQISTIVSEFSLNC